MSKSLKTQSHKKLFENIKSLLHEARTSVARNINTAMVMTYFEIGRMIVEHEQDGAKRAGYAKETLKLLSQKLTAEFGRGFSVDNLQRMRSFYLMYKKSGTLSRISPKIFQLSWSHYVFLMRLPEAERKFYEIEAVKQNWSLRELERGCCIAN